MFKILFLTVLVISVRLSASAVLLEVESGTAVFSSNLSGSIRKIGAGILMLTGINTLTSLDVAEGTILVCSKANLNNFGIDIPITLSTLGTVQSQDSGMFMTGDADGTTISSLTFFPGDHLMVTEGIISLGSHGKLPCGENSILGDTVLKLTSGGAAGVISSATYFGGASQFHIPTMVTPGSITGPVLFDGGATVVLSANASDAGILGVGGSYTFCSGAKIVLGKGSSWTTNLSVL